MDVSLSLPKAAIAALCVVVTVIVLLMAWIGGELHYRNCIEATQARYPVSLQQPAAPVQAEREDAISSCSRWP